MTSAVGVSMDAERASGAAKRRRERRLRSWWRHERMTVAAELTVALHHSRGVGPAVPHEALRGQTPASSMGRRPGVLKEPLPPVVVEHAACPCSGAPLLAVPSLAAAESDGVDGTTVKYLLKLALKEKEKEEERLNRSACWRSTGGSATTCRSPQPSTRLGRSGPVALCPLPGRGERGRRGGRGNFLATLHVLAWLFVILVGMDQKDIYAATHFPLLLPALYALGNLDFLRATGIWHHVRCLSRRRSTGKFGVFWVFTTRNYFFSPLFLAVTCAVYSTTL